MTNARNNLLALGAEKAELTETRALLAWGPIALAMLLTGITLAVIWLKGDLVDMPTREAKLVVTIWIVVGAAAVIVLHLGLLAGGAYRVVGRAFRAELRERGAEVQPNKPTKRDAPLQTMRDELRAAHGLRWRYRQSWLLLTGDATTIKRLLPAIGDSGWLNTGDAILLWNGSGEHGQPDSTWLKQLYKLRRRRPVDGIVMVQDGATELAAQRRGINADSVNLTRIAETLKWSATIYVLDVAETDATHDGNTPVIGYEFGNKHGRAQDATAIANALLNLRDQLSQRGIAQIIADDDRRDTYAAKLSQRLDTRSTLLAAWIASLSGKQRRHQPIGGAFFAPYPLAASSDDASRVDLPLWLHLGLLARRARGRRVGFHPVTVFSAIALVGVGVWTAGMAVSTLTNARELHLTQQALQALNTSPDSATSVRALLSVQQRIELYEHRIDKRPPFWTRFGLNQDKATLVALWQPYSQAAHGLLVTPIQSTLEAKLADLGQMPTDEITDRTNKVALDGHKALKTYLMLADPQRADASFMAPVLEAHWSAPASLPPGAKLDLSERLLGFYAQHLKAHDDWRIQPQPDLVAAARQTLQAIIVVKNSEDTIYQSILDAVGTKYPDQTLASLTTGTDTRGLLRTAATVPGAFTRQAYEGTVASEIAKAAERSAVAGDWVLNADAEPAGAESEAPAGDSLKADLTTRYFADYADEWQTFMNSIQWESASTMPATIEQLKPMADARQSPVIALMKSLAYQGGAGATKVSLSDTLVAKAQNVFSKKDDAPAAQKPDPAGPLGAAFGPVLRLMPQDTATASNPNANSDLSLQRYLDRITALRLKLQQMSNSANADAQAKQVALALFQGKGSDLAETQAYADMMAASLGAEWAGMGEALFVRPVAQALQTVMLPAQASLNDAWRQTIAATWSKSFAGRYPFANTDNDASIPELARFLRPQGGLIHGFLGTQLAGVLELQGDRWVPVAGSVGDTSGTLAFDPDFLKAINTLQKIAAHMLVQGEPQYRFDLQPVPTPGLTDILLSLDGQKLHYYNQRETWQALTWPSNNPQNLGTRLQWQTEQAGTSKNLEYTGRWGLVRMLERAQIEPIDNATLQLTWSAKPDTPAKVETPLAEAQIEQAPMTPAPQTVTYPIRYLMRTEVGSGPLELLALRGFVMPQRIFSSQQGGRVPARSEASSSSAKQTGA